MTTQRGDGSRTGDETWQEAKAAFVKIRADAHDTHDSDINEMISLCLKKDGGNLSADIPMNSHKFTGVENASARTHFAAAGQVQDNSLSYAGTSSGNDTITASLTPAITAYATGMLVAFKAGGTNTGAATLNLNSVGAANLRKGKTGSLALSAGDIAAGKMVLGVYDGTNFQQIGADEFPTGTRILFQQTDAPTGWTKDTSHNDKAMRVVSGTASSGGSVAFTTAFASKSVSGTVGDTTLTINQIPAHTHNITNASSGSGNDLVSRSDGQAPGTSVTQSQGGGQSHTHSFTGNAINLAVQYLDCIIAAKD